MMKTGIKILKLMLEDSKPRTIREISKQIKADYRITYTATQQLIKKDIIETKTVGKSTVCQLNSAYYGNEIYQAEDERRQYILNNSDIKQLTKEITTKAGTNLYIMLLFGSYARGNKTKASDIDLLFITNDKDFEDRIHSLLDLLPLRTHVLVFTEKEFIRMKDAKKPNVVQEAMAHAIILYGIEAYHQMKNA